MPGISLGYRTPVECYHVCRAYGTGIIGLAGYADTLAFRRGYRRGGAVCECEPGGWLDVRSLATGHDWAALEAV